jgi:protoporphyrinogen oxidase
MKHGKELMAKIVILGAGLTGLSAAYHLEKKGFFDYKIFEKDSTVGGLCRSVYQDGFTFDYTGHLLHASDPYFQTFIAHVVGMEHLQSVIRRSYIYSQNVYTHYPFQINLFGLPAETIAECIEGFVLKKKTKQVRSFYDWALYNFGKGIARHFFFPFQKKIFSYDLKKVTSSWTGRFVPSTSLSQMIYGAIKDPAHDQKVGYNAHFYYPKQGGIFFWIEKIAHALANPIKVNGMILEEKKKDKTKEK